MPRYCKSGAYISASSDTSSNSSTSTIDAIRDICDGCDKRPHFSSHSCDNPKRKDTTRISCVTTERQCFPTGTQDYCPQSRYDPGVSYFTSVITPITGLSGFSGIGGSVEFKMRRKNKTVTLQWEPFTGTLSSSGVAYVTVAQNICNTPPYVVSFPIYLVYKGTGRNTRVEIDPFARTGNIRFYLNTDGTSTGTATGDSISVSGGAVSWIVD